jgi:hypothetical protein
MNSQLKCPFLHNRSKEMGYGVERPYLQFSSKKPQPRNLMAGSTDVVNGRYI